MSTSITSQGASPCIICPGPHLSSRSFRLRDVTNLPSLPAKGEVLTLNIIDTDGSSTLMVGSAMGDSLVATVSPIWGSAEGREW